MEAVSTGLSPKCAEADWIVDATGRNSRASRWLTEQGYPAPEEEGVSPYLGYATRLYGNVRLPEGTKAVLTMATPPDQPRGGVLLPVENGLYICTLYGVSGAYPGGEEECFQAHAESLRSQTIARAIETAHPLTPIKLFRKDRSTYRLYGEKGIWPEGFLVIGDAIASFNPLYGQGMTSAILQAEALDSLLKAGARRSARTIQRKLTRQAAAAWKISTNEDLRWPATQGGKRTLEVRFAHWLGDRVLAAATRDEVVSLAYQSVLHMTRGPLAILHPRVAARLLFARR